MRQEEIFMKEALGLAHKAAAEGEVPVGAVVVKDGVIVAKGQNKREKGENALYHAEIVAIDNACRVLKSWRLCDCEIYVTLEPCPMCAGAIINSRIKRVVFGANDKKAGSCGSLVDLFELPYNHKPDVVRGILEKECAKVLTDFFKERRKKTNLASGICGPGFCTE